MISGSHFVSQCLNVQVKSTQSDGNVKFSTIANRSSMGCLNNICWQIHVAFWCDRGLIASTKFGPVSLDSFLEGCQ